MTGSTTDIADIKLAAAGHWEDIIRSVGIGAEYLTGAHGPCPKCRTGDDRWRVFKDFKDTGGAYCNQCGKNLGDGFKVVAWWKGCDFRTAVKVVADSVGFRPNGNGRGATVGPKEDPVTTIARVKHIPSPESIVAFGAKAINDAAVCLPAYGPDGRQCTSFTVRIMGTAKEQKGLFARGKPAGLFFPREKGSVRLPRPGETWHVVEGFKDAATLHHLGYLAVGLNTSFLAGKFASLFTGVNVVLIPDRDQAGESGARKSTASLHGHASSVLLAVLPAKCTAKNGKDVRDVLRITGGEALIREAIAKAKPPELLQEPEMPTVCVGFNEERVASEVMPVLGNLGWSDAGDEPLRVYQRAGQLVEVTKNVDTTVCGVELPAAMLRIRLLPAAILRERITSAVRLEGPPNQDGTPTVIRPPNWLVNAIHLRGQYPPTIRSLTGIVRSPTLRPDGTVIQEPGYDGRTGLLFIPDGEYPLVPDQPTKEQAIQAAAELLDVVCDFPFSGEEHRSVWLAMLLTLAGRSAIAGPCPMFVIDANTRGTGKTMLCDAAGVIAYGDRLARKAWPDQDEEVRKTITAVALEGLTTVLWDNIASVLGCPSLDAALTGMTWQDRILSTNTTTGVLPLNTVWAATGNNISLGADTARRVLYCRIKSDRENPEERSDFVRANLLAWVKQNRHRLAVCAVTILRAYVHAGRPDQHLTPWGSYEPWSDLIRNAIVWLGLPDPWETRAIVREADRSTELLGLIHAGVAEADPDNQGVTSGQIVQLLNTPVEHGKDDKYPQLRAAITEFCGAKIDGRKIGYQLRQYVGRVKDGRQLCRETAHGGVAKWSVRDLDRWVLGGDGGHGGDVSTPSRARKTTSV